jgi:hypothetical protein
MRNGYRKVYSNTFDAIGKTFRAEGVRGIQRGLTAAYAYSVCPTLPAYLPKWILNCFDGPQTVLQMSVLGQ